MGIHKAVCRVWERDGPCLIATVSQCSVRQGYELDTEARVKV